MLTSNKPSMQYAISSLRLVVLLAIQLILLATDAEAIRSCRFFPRKNSDLIPMTLSMISASALRFAILLQYLL